MTKLTIKEPTLEDVKPNHNQIVVNFPGSPPTRLVTITVVAASYAVDTKEQEDGSAYSISVVGSLRDTNGYSSQFSLIKTSSLTHFAHDNEAAYSDYEQAMLVRVLGMHIVDRFKISLTAQH